MIGVPRTGSILASPTTKKEYRVLGPADLLYPDRFKTPSSVKAGTRLWILQGFELDDELVMKSTNMLRCFHQVEPGIPGNTQARRLERLENADENERAEYERLKQKFEPGQETSKPREEGE